MFVALLVLAFVVLVVLNSVFVPQDEWTKLKK